MRPDAARPNVFAGPHVDRLKLPRDDAQAVARLIAGGSARVIPVWRSRLPVVREPEPGVLLLEFGAAAVGTVAHDELILLGEFRGTAVFATEIQAEAPPALDGGAEFADLRLAAGLLPHDQAGLVAYARAMVSFRHRHRYCGSCGAPTASRQSGHMMICTREACATEFFPRLDPAIIVLVTDGDRTLLGRQPSWPEGRYSTIAGFVEPGESLEDAVRREVLEETGIETGTACYQSSQPWPFPRSLMIGFRAEARTREIRLAGDELEDARWFSREDIAQGRPRLPFPQSIAYRLIEEWYDAGAARPLAEEPAVQAWNRRR